MSVNDVILTAGFAGAVPPRYIRQIVRVDGGHVLWPIAEAPLNALVALSTERMEAANLAAASVTASFADQHPEDEEDYAIE
eukprot:2292606-Alexandrium_andersonii.AAC.1